MKWSYYEDWPEIISFILLVLGFLAALFVSSAVILYTLIFIAGLGGGRVWFRVKNHLKASWSLILLGFLIGFVLGSRYGDDRIIVFFYIFGIVLSYYLHDKGIVKSLEI